MGAERFSPSRELQSAAVLNHVFSFQLAMTGRVSRDRYGMPKLLLVTFVLTGLLCYALSAAAQTDGSQEAKLWFAAHDRNHDGFITVDEVIGYETKLFIRMDNEKSGRLRQDQYCAGIPTYNRAEQNRCHDRFVKIDADHDAYITLEEIQDFYRLVLQAADLRGDGHVTLDEWLAATDITP